MKEVEKRTHHNQVKEEGTSQRKGQVHRVLIVLCLLLFLLPACTTIPSVTLPATSSASPAPPASSLFPISATPSETLSPPTVQPSSSLPVDSSPAPAPSSSSAIDPGTPPSPAPTSPANEKSPATPTFLATALRQDQDGWIHLVIQGDPYQRGLQHGYLLAGEIVEAIRVRDALLQMDMGLTFAEVCATATEMYGPMLDQEIRQEMQGIADGANLAGEELTIEEVLGWNSLIDLSTMWAVNTSGSSLNDHCSAFIATGSYTQDGEIVMGHNSWADYAGFAAWRVMLDLRPEQGHRILMQSAPGLVWSGSDYFITDAGLVGCETTFFNWQRFDPAGLPAFLRTRWAMQYADSIDRFVEILNDRNNGGYANGWLLGDVRTNEIARFEQGLSATRLDRTVDGYYAGYNAAEDLAIQAESGGWNADDPSNFSGARRIRWGQLLEANKGSLDAELGMTMLGDHFDTWLEIEEPSSRTLCGHYEQYGAPCGAMDGKVTTSEMARQMSTWARWGLPCGIPFSAAQAIAVNPDYSHLEGLLTDLPTQTWARF